MCSCEVASDSCAVSSSSSNLPDTTELHQPSPLHTICPKCWCTNLHCDSHEDDWNNQTLDLDNTEPVEISWNLPSNQGASQPYHSQPIPNYPYDQALLTEAEIMATGEMDGLYPSAEGDFNIPMDPTSCLQTPLWGGDLHDAVQMCLQSHQCLGQHHSLNVNIQLISCQPFYPPEQQCSELQHHIQQAFSQNTPVSSPPITHKDESQLYIPFPLTHPTPLDIHYQSSSNHYTEVLQCLEAPSAGASYHDDLELTVSTPRIFESGYISLGNCYDSWSSEI